MDGQIVLTAAGGWPSTTNGAAGPTLVEYTTNDVDLYHLDFDQTTTEYTQWTLVMPSDYNGGTITAVFYWTVTGGGAAETVRWALQGRSYGNDEAIDQAWGTAQTVDDTWIADNDVHITAATAAITLAGTPAASELAQIRAYCDAANSDLGGDARLIAVRITFTRA